MQRHVRGGGDEAWVLSERNALEPLHHQAPSSCKSGRIDQTGEACLMHTVERRSNRSERASYEAFRSAEGGLSGPGMSLLFMSPRSHLHRWCEASYSSFKLKLPLYSSAKELNDSLIGRPHTSHSSLLAL